MVLGLPAGEYRVTETVRTAVGVAEIEDSRVIRSRDQDRTPALEDRDTAHFPPAERRGGDTVAKVLLAVPDREIVDVTQYEALRNIVGLDAFVVVRGIEAIGGTDHPRIGLRRVSDGFR